MGAAAGGGVVEEEVEKSCCGSQLLLVDMQSKEEKKKNSNSWVLPPGFRFHPTDEELVLYYLKRKILRRHIHLPSIVGEVDVYKWQPWELPALLTTTNTSSSNRDEKQWYLFSPRDRKYPNGSRSNRATQFGYWKSTGKDRPITTQCSRSSRRTTVGNKKTLVYYHGRAPRGQRTDWVMHEYTLLLDTDTNYDCYALYKLFRKSGPGPKNGEHYGAPFQEEDWEDDDDAHDIFNEQTPSSSKQVQVDTNATLPDYNLEQVLLKLSRELDVDHQYHSQVEDEVVQSDQLVGLSSRADATTSAQHTTNTWWEQGAGETSNQIAPSTSVVCAQSLEMPGVTSLIGCSEQGQLKTDEDEEFLEIVDFGDTGSAVWSMEDNSNNVVCLPKNDGLYDPFDYYYFDAEMYLAEALGPLDGATPPNLYLDDFGEENQATFHMISELWTHEQDFSVSEATTEPNQVASMTSVSTASGVLSNNGSLSDIGGGDTHQEPISDSRFSSALSAFLDSIPSSPAIAAESPLISKALQRVSSFRTPGGAAALVPNAAAAAAATGNGRRRRRRGGTNNSGFLFISFLVGLGAVFWVLTIGISVKIIKGIWTRLS